MACYDALQLRIVQITYGDAGISIGHIGQLDVIIWATAEIESLHAGSPRGGGRRLIACQPNCDNVSNTGPKAIGEGRGRRGPHVENDIIRHVILSVE